MLSQKRPGLLALGGWDLAGSRGYLDYSSASRSLLGWLEHVGQAYAEIQADAANVRKGLPTMRRDRDEWASFASIITRSC